MSIYLACQIISMKMNKLFVVLLLLTGASCSYFFTGHCVEPNSPHFNPNHSRCGEFVSHCANAARDPDDRARGLLLGDLSEATDAAGSGRGHQDRA